jgi:hypothetical protein
MQALRPRKSPRPVSSQSQPPSGYDAKVLLRTMVLINGINPMCSSSVQHDCPIVHEFAEASCVRSKGLAAGVYSAT